MSWEEVRTKCVACPCGQGKIEQKEYMDDWNRIEYSTPTIVCPICSKKYKVCTEHHDSYKPGRGSWNNYYLIPIDYPEYFGTQEATVYPRKTLSFAEMLVENYTLGELKLAQEVAEHCRSSASLTGVAALICTAHRKTFDSVKIQGIREQIANAIVLYPNYSGTKEQRDIVRKQEEVERNFYEEEKAKYKVPIDL